MVESVQEFGSVDASIRDFNFAKAQTNRIIQSKEKVDLIGNILIIIDEISSSIEKERLQLRSISI